MANDNSQLNWLKSADSEKLPFISMIVGWQTVRETINSTVDRFNKNHFEKPTNNHHAMKIIAAKQTVMASLRELRLSLGSWRDKLAISEKLSEESKLTWKKLLPILEKIHTFRDVRNTAFHFGDMTTPPLDLISLYEYIDRFDLEEMNAMLRALHDFGEQLSKDARVACGMM